MLRSRFCRVRLLLLACLFLVSLLLAGCSTRRPDSLASAGPPAQSPADAPPQLLQGLPRLQDLPATTTDPRSRGSSFETGCAFPDGPETVLADSPLRASSNAVPDTGQHTITLSAPAGGTSWSIYQFQGRAAAMDAGFVYFNYSIPAGQRIYVGLSEYGRNAWEWRSLDLGASAFGHDLFDADLAKDYSSPAGVVYIAFVCYDLAEVTLSSVDFYLNTKRVMVDNFEATDGGSQDSVTLSWDAVPGASGYQLCAFQGLEHVDLTLNDGAATSFVHDATTMPGLPPMPNSIYNYRIRASFPDGQSSITAGGPGGTGLLIPQAWGSYRSNRFGIQLGWEAAPGATGYEIYTDLGSTLVATLPADARSYFDFQPAIDSDFSERTYSIYPLDANGLSQFGQHPTCAVLDGASSELDAGHYLYGRVAAETYLGRPCFTVSDPGGDVWFEAANTIIPQDSSDFEDYFLDFGSAAISGPLALATVSGLPALCACTDKGVLTYGYCDSDEPATAASWHTSIASGELGSTTAADLIDMNGVPGVAVISEEGLRFFYLTSDTPQGPQDWDSQLIAPNLDFSRQCDMLSTQDTICIAFTDVDRNLSVAVSTAYPPQSAADWNLMLVEADSVVEAPISIALDLQGHLGIAYAAEADDNNSSSLRYAVCSVMPPQGLADWDSMEVHNEAGKFCGRSPKLLLVNGRPSIISYRDDLSDDARSLLLCKSMPTQPSETKHWDFCTLASGIGTYNSSHLNAVVQSNGGFAVGYTDHVADKIKLEFYHEIVH